MRHMKDVYEKGQYTDTWAGGESFSAPSDYQPMLNELGTIAVQEEIGEYYEGDYYLLYEKEGAYGYLCVGWGSCSGCDALQGCDSIEEMNDLALELQAKIQWFDSAAEALEWFVKHDWEGEFRYRGDAVSFVKRCKKYLEDCAEGR